MLHPCALVVHHHDYSCTSSVNVFHLECMQSSTFAVVEFMACVAGSSLLLFKVCAPLQLSIFRQFSCRVACLTHQLRTQVQ